MAGDGNDNIFLGFDFSTQQVKVLALNEKLDIFYEEHVQFDADFPKYNTKGGVHIHDDNMTVTAPTIMWVEALDLLLNKMKAASFPFNKVAALSGDGQQHGSVYWKTGANKSLSNMDPGKSFAEQLKECFSIGDSPVWMDASTSSQCRHLEDAVGGPQKLADITGSRAFERFTGSQIMKVYQTNKQVYDDTERISLVSSFAASLFIGDYAPTDDSDATGTNLIDIWKRDWDPKCLHACGGESLYGKLGAPAHPTKSLGCISQYLVERWGFNPKCVVSGFVGDNPASLAGLGTQESDVIVSLGTSDTVFVSLNHPTPGPEGHVFAHPVLANHFMALTCFKNASLAREKIRDEQAKASWEIFDKMLTATPAGNNGNIGFYFDVTEIQPFVQGRYRFDAEGKKVSSFSSEVEVRAVVESQFLARRMYAQQVGLKLGSDTRVLATGGASQNTAILQVIADIFQSPVFVVDVPNSACVGNAIRAQHTWLEGKVPFSEIVKGLHTPQLAATPNTELSKVYSAMLDRYSKLEKKVAVSSK